MNDQSNPLPDMLTMQDVADMDAEYNVLLRQFINACSGMNTAVSIAALMSAAGCIAVTSIEDEAACYKYLETCTSDILVKVKPAYEARAKQEAESGVDTGEESQDGNQVVA